MKSSVPQLAAFGGRPLFPQPLHVGQPVITDHELLLSDLDRVLRSGQLTNHGPQVRAFEEAVCGVAGTRHCIALCNATTALQVAARALQLTGELIMPSFTFIATAHAMEWIGLTPVFADVDPLTHTLDPDSVAACVTPRTSAILPVHLWGHVCDPAELTQVATRHGLRLLFDASHAFGCRRAGTPAGGLGDAEVFSFHATKFVHSVEGGAIVTNSDALAERCRRLRGFGITGLQEVSDIGTNGKMHELSAATGLRSIAAMPELLRRNHENRAVYAEWISAVPGLKLLPRPSAVDTNAQYVVAVVDEDQFGLSRDQLVAILRSEGVFVRSYFTPGCHRAVPYADAPPDRHMRVPLPVTEQLLRSVMQFPTGRSVAPADIERIGALLQSICASSGEIRRRLATGFGRIVWHPADPARPRDNALREAG